MDALAKIDRYLKGYYKSWSFGGNILVDTGDGVYRGSFGSANMEESISNSDNHRFRLFSVSKGFTAMAVMKLQQQGLLKVQDYLHSYIPEFAKLSKEITIHHMLTHSAGLYNHMDGQFWLEGVKKPIADSEVIREVIEEGVQFEPGREFEYQNSGYIMLRKIIESVSGMSFGEFLKKSIFDPLEMKDSGVFSHEKAIIYISSNYERLGKGFSPGVEVHCPNYYGSGGVYSTIDDMLKWHRGLTEPSFCTKEMQVQIFQDHIANYGYGWGIWDEEGQTVTNHYGGFPGVGGVAAIRRYAPSGQLIVLLSNYGLPNYEKICDDLESILRGGDPGVPERPIKQSVAVGQLKKLQGDYLGFLNVKVQADAEEGVLEIFVNENTSTRAYPLSPLIYQDEHRDFQYNFEEGPDGDISLWGIKKSIG